MKDFIIKVALMTLVSCSVLPIIDIIMLNSVNRWSYYSHERNVFLSYNRLLSLKDSNKIVIVAGSNGGFGVNSRMINEAFNIPVVNTCTHASIGTRMQFEMYKEFLRKGDIVVFCPEYDSGISRLYGGSVLLRIVSTHLPSAYKKVSFDQWLYLHKYIGIHFNEVVNCPDDIEEFDGPYSAKAINEYGDIEWERTHKDSIKISKLRGVMDDKLIAYYKYIHNYTKANGIKLVFIPPTFMRSNFKSCAKQIDSLTNCLKKNGIPWYSSPSKYSFDDSLYYDTPYHMTQSGAAIRTELLIEDLREIMNCKK